MDSSKWHRISEIETTCICRNSLLSLNNMTEQVLHCVNPACRRVEHFHCVFPNEVLSWPIEQHHCIKCRMDFADPFWRSVTGPQDIIPPTFVKPIIDAKKFTSKGKNGENFQAIERQFLISRSDLDKIRAHTQKILVVCMQLGDEVQFRYHWPKHCTLTVNQQQFRVYSRHGENSITKGQRDDPFSIGPLVHVGTNKILLNCYDSQSYVICVRVVEQTAKSTVYNMIHSSETLSAAIHRIKRIVGSQLSCCDLDDEVQATTLVMSLKCPFSSTRIQIPGRLLNVDSLECVFDLNAFLKMVEKTRKWACPHTLQASSIHYLAKDTWLEAILNTLKNFPEIDQIEVNAEAKWRICGESTWKSPYDSNPINHLPTNLTLLKYEAVKVEEEEESDDEAMEMKEAAEAAKLELHQHRRTHLPTDMEVIDLLSSGDDDEETQTTILQSQVVNSTEVENGDGYLAPIADQLSRNVKNPFFYLAQNPSGELGAGFPGRNQVYQLVDASHQSYPLYEYTGVTPIYISPVVQAPAVSPGMNNDHLSTPSNLEANRFVAIADLRRKRDWPVNHVRSRNSRKKRRNLNSSSTFTCAERDYVELD
eukprot:g2106.t1